MGYSFGKKGWRVYDLDKYEFLVSRDVVFDETTFPFQHQPSESSAEASSCQDTVFDEDWIISPPVHNRGSLVTPSTEEETSDDVGRTSSELEEEPVTENRVPVAISDVEVNNEVLDAHHAPTMTNTLGR